MASFWSLCQSLFEAINAPFLSCNSRNGSGIAFATPGPGPSLAYTTTDGGVSWKPLLTLDDGVVNQLYRFDKDTIYGIGPSTLLRSTDCAVPSGRLTFLEGSVAFHGGWL